VARSPLRTPTSCNRSSSDSAGSSGKGWDAASGTSAHAGRAGTSRDMATSVSQGRRATRLRHAPTRLSYDRFTDRAAGVAKVLRTSGGQSGHSESDPQYICDICGRHAGGAPR
jgi:hypothetical protein